MNEGMQFDVAGIKFRLAAFALADVNYGDKLTLKPEPTNEHDKNAIAVYKGEHHIGYVPRRLTSVLVPVETLECVCTKCRSDACTVSARRVDAQVMTE